MNGEITTGKHTLFHAIRPLNLLLLSITISVYYLSFIKAEINANNFVPRLNYLDLLLLNLGSICLATSGNLINDFFDYDADKNKQTKKQFGLKSDYLIYYYGFFGVGLLSSILLLYRQTALSYIPVYFLIASLLFIYSSHLKSTVLLGNIIIALLTSIAFPLVFVFELTTLASDQILQKQILTYTIYFFVFAFLTNLIREIAKDKLDSEIDTESGIKTFANSYNIQTIRSLLFFVSLCLIAIISAWLYFSYYAALKFNFMLAAILIQSPAIYLAFRILKIKGVKDFKLISSLSKLNMAEALIYLILNPWI